MKPNTLFLISCALALLSIPVKALYVLTFFAPESRIGHRFDEWLK